MRYGGSFIASRPRVTLCATFERAGDVVVNTVAHAEALVRSRSRAELLEDEDALIAARTFADVVQGLRPFIRDVLRLIDADSRGAHMLGAIDRNLLAALEGAQAVFSQPRTKGD